MPYTRLRYHIITATKHREPLLTDRVEDIVYAALRKEAERIGGRISHIGGVEDHVHIIAAIPPSLAVSKFIGHIKSESSKGINYQLSELQHFSWQRGFGAFTLNPADMGDVVAYVLNQKAHHKSGELLGRFERLD